MKEHQVSHWEKKWFTASVLSRMELVLSLFGASLVLLAMVTPTISAKENTPTTNASNNETTTALAQPLTDTVVNSGKNESDISSPNSANASLEKKRKKNLQQSQQILLQAQLIQHHKLDKIVQVRQLLLLVQ